MPLFECRPATSADHPFVFSSFLLSCREAYPLCRVPGAIYFRGQQAVIDHLLETAECRVLAFPEDPREFIGYILFQYSGDNALVVHWLYVKQDFRNKHHATELVDSVRGGRSLIVATHISNRFGILKNKLPGCRVVYDPFLVPQERALHARSA